MIKKLLMIAVALGVIGASRRRRHHLYSGWCAKGCRRGRLYEHHLAHEARARQNRRTWSRQRAAEQVRNLVVKPAPAFPSRTVTNPDVRLTRWKLSPSAWRSPRPM